MSKKDLKAFSTSSAAIPDIDDFAAGLSTTAQTELRGAYNGSPILRMNRSGYWTYGPEAIEVEEGSEWAVNSLSLKHGWISWSDGKPAGEFMVSMGKPVPPNEDIGHPPGEPWTKQFSVEMKCVSGEDEGEQVVFKGNSIGVADAFGALVPSIVDKMQAGDPAYIPVVTLENESYQHKTYGKIYKPVLAVKRWVTLDGDEQGKIEEEQPKRGRRRRQAA
mgnify:FL=1